MQTASAVFFVFYSMKCEVMFDVFVVSVRVLGYECAADGFAYVNVAGFRFCYKKRSGFSFIALLKPYLKRMSSVDTSTF